jgi:hypothetical protein
MKRQNFLTLSLLVLRKGRNEEEVIEDVVIEELKIEV